MYKPSLAYALYDYAESQPSQHVSPGESSSFTFATHASQQLASSPKSECGHFFSTEHAHGTGLSLKLEQDGILVASSADLSCGHEWYMNVMKSGV